MNKLYVVTVGKREWDDTDLIGVFSTFSNAQKAGKNWIKEEMKEDCAKVNEADKNGIKDYFYHVEQVTIDETLTLFNSMMLC